MKHDEMLEFMPHRGRNVVIDDFVPTKENAGQGYLTIAEGDPAGRDLFLVSGPGGLRYSHVFLVEHVALASFLCIQSDMGGGRIAYFSKVTKYERKGDASAGTPLVSSLTRGRDRGEFQRPHLEDAAARGGEDREHAAPIPEVRGDVFGDHPVADRPTSLARPMVVAGQEDRFVASLFHKPGHQFTHLSRSILRRDQHRISRRHNDHFV